MADSRILNVALIGAGMVARTHVAAIHGAGLRLAAIVSRGGPKATALAQDAADLQGHPVQVTELADIANDPQIDFAIVVTPPDARASIIGPLIAAGKPVLLEKPIGRTLAEAQQIVDLAAAAQVPLGVVFQHRVRAASVKATELMKQGGLGALGLVEISVPWWREQAYYDEPGRGTYARDGGGVLISQAIHTIDLALSLAGPVTKVTAMTATTRFHDMEAEDFASAGLCFANGAVGSLVASTASFPGGAERIVLHCENASLHLESGLCRLDWRDGRTETFGAEAGTGGRADPMAFTHEWHQSILEDFVASLKENRPPIASGDSALAAHVLIDAITKSAATGQTQELAT